jgi:hypothetical protein
MVTVKVERADAYDLWGDCCLARARVDNFLSSTEKAFDVNRVRRDFAPDSLLWRIKSLFSKNRFPVRDEFIPCSVAQGIFGGSSCKLLESQLFSRRFCAENGEISANSLLLPCSRPFWSFERSADGRIVGTGHARKTPIRDAAAPIRVDLQNR